eukprot:scaffold271655_cov30-Tisochrysis_lutea.AAC.1
MHGATPRLRGRAEIIRASPAEVEVNRVAKGLSRRTVGHDRGLAPKVHPHVEFGSRAPGHRIEPIHRLGVQVRECVGPAQ